LDRVRSYAAHEDELYNRIIPLIHDTFEAYDDETANVLQSFFGAYALAVKYAIAKNTRKLLREGEAASSGGKGGGGGGGITVPRSFSEDELPQQMRLQEFGLRYVLVGMNRKKLDGDDEEGGGESAGRSERRHFDKIMVGASQPEQVVDTVQIVTKVLSEQQP